MINKFNYMNGKDDTDSMKDEINIDELNIIDYSSDFDSDMPQVIKRNNKFNYINKFGYILLEEWVDQTYFFKCGIGRIQNNGKWNYVDEHGKLILNNWVRLCYNFHCGVGIVYYSKYECIIIDKTGKPLCNRTYIEIRDFKYGYAQVRSMGGWNFIDTTGKLISKVWYEFVGQFNNDNIAAVYDRKKGINLINRDGNFVLENWVSMCDVCDSFEEDFYCVYYKNDKFKVDENGNLICFVE